MLPGDAPEFLPDWQSSADIAHVLVEQDARELGPLLQSIAAMDGPIPIVQLGGRDRPYRTDWMLEEVAVSVDTTAAGGNASLMAVA